MFNFDIFCLHRVFFFGLEDEEDNFVKEVPINISYPSVILMER